MDLQNNFMHVLLCEFLLYFTLFGSVFSSLNDVTSNVGLGGKGLGALAAFGDFNADKKADLFFIENSKGEQPCMKCDKTCVYFVFTSRVNFCKTKTENFTCIFANR